MTWPSLVKDSLKFSELDALLLSICFSTAVVHLPKKANITDDSSTS